MALSKPLAETASFAFGEIPIVFQSGDSDWLSYLDLRYGAFRIDEPESGFFIRFEPTGMPAPKELASPLAAHLESVRCAETAVGFRTETQTSSCDIDLFSRLAVLRGPRAMYPLDNLLRHLLPILWERGVLLHAAALSNGRGIVACGPSGAGKSTLARLAAANALCDELCAVGIEDGGDTFLTSLPFWMSRPGRAELGAILMLRHGERHHLEPLGQAAALRALASQVLWPVWVESAMKRTFDHLAAVVESVPVFELAFAPRLDVWHFIEQEVP